MLRCLGEARVKKIHEFKLAFSGDGSVEQQLAKRKDALEKSLASVYKSIEKLKSLGTDVKAHEEVHAGLVGNTSDLDKLASGKANAEALKLLKKVDGLKKKVAEAMAKAKPKLEVLKTMDADTLDTLVDGLGDKAGTAEERELILNAIEARFGIHCVRQEEIPKAKEGEHQFTVHWSKKATPRLYKALNMVPDWHTTGNDDLEKIRRTRSGKEGASVYDSGSKEIVLELGRTGKWPGSNTSEYFPDGQHKVTVSEFDATTLHEVGHAVDEKTGWMKKKGKEAAYGGWKEGVRPAEIFNVVDDHFKIYGGDFAKWPNRAIDLFLHDVMSNGKNASGKNFETWVSVVAPGIDPKKLINDAGLKEAEAKRVQYEKDGWPDDVGTDVMEAGKKFQDPMLKMAQEHMALIEAILRDRVPLAKALENTQTDDMPAKEDWKKLKDHDGVKWLIKCKLRKSHTGLWDDGKRGASGAAIKGRVYQEAYGGNWVSYLLKAQDSGVCTYQFRAPSEWLAELYAMYFSGNLPETHAAHKWLKENFDTAKAPE
jgi:hypothetical protein